jgi:hypothetical protein
MTRRIVLLEQKRTRMHLTSPDTLSLTFQPRYSLAMRALHWLVFLGAVVAVAAVEFRDVFPKGSTERAAMMAIHESAGIDIGVDAVASAGASEPTGSSAAGRGPTMDGPRGKRHAFRAVVC